MILVKIWKLVVLLILVFLMMLCGRLIIQFCNRQMVKGILKLVCVSQIFKQFLLMLICRCSFNSGISVSCKGIINRLMIVVIKSVWFGKFIYVSVQVVKVVMVIGIMVDGMVMVSVFMNVLVILFVDDLFDCLLLFRLKIRISIVNRVILVQMLKLCGFENLRLLLIIFVIKNVVVFVVVQVRIDSRMFGLMMLLQFLSVNDGGMVFVMNMC